MPNTKHTTNISARIANFVLIDALLNSVEPL
jgi:hypothetical protein